jgi:mRNA guanylyltransferase
MHSSVPPQIPGELIPNSEAVHLKQTVAELLERDNLRFPGAQPVSFAREHIAELQREEYFMCEKTDGVRCLLFLHFKDDGQGGFMPATILIDRKNNYYDVQPPLRFPFYQTPNDPNTFLFNTVLDGELVHDMVKGQPVPRLIYYVFDCLVVDAKNLTSRPLDKRVGHMKDLVFKPYHRWRAQHGGQPMGPEPFAIKEKPLYPPYSLKEMFENVLPNLPHGNDGLVFTCKRTPYKFGTDPNILKWKPPRENTIDFKLKLGEFPLFDPHDGEEGLIPDYDAMPKPITLHVQHNNNEYLPFAEMYLTEEDWEMLKSLNQRLDGRIIECYRDDFGRWTFKRDEDGTPRWRDDKKDANHISTVKKVLESIEDPVTEDDLLASSLSIRNAIYRLRNEEQELAKQKINDVADREAKKRKFSESNGIAGA